MTREQFDKLDQHDGCPCLVIGPCSYACSCVHPAMSGGCQRCAKYGSDEQRRAAANGIARALSSTSLTRDEIGVLEAALLNGMNPAGKLMIATGWNVILGKLHAMKSLLLSATRQLPPCPKCGETDVQAAGPDWTDTGVKAEITCPRCEHAWTADFQIACTASATGSASGSNYVCDHETFPQKVTFANGRVVKMVGQGHLFVGWEE